MAVDVPVLIVGSGPVGLMSAILLARQGIESLVVERRDALHQAPQAHVVNCRSLEICRAAGIEVDALRRAGTPASDGAAVVWMTRLAGEEIGRLSFGGRLPKLIAATPTPMLNLPQHLFEPLLHDHLRRLGGDVRFGSTWESSTSDADGVRSTVRDGAGRALEITSRWLLAADGAGSRVRRALDIDLIGPDRLASMVMIYFEGDLRPVVRDRPGILYWIMEPGVGGTFIAHDIDHTWVYMHPWDPDRESRDDYTNERCAAIVRRAIGSDDVAFDVRDVSPWTMTAQVAERYAVGRTFLVGDAAHRFPPTGGLGMNTGIQDAHNLAWKLGAVERGWASAALLESYEPERRAVAQANTDQSLANAGKMFEVAQALGLSSDVEASGERMRETLENPAGRERVRIAIEDQAEHFDMFALDVGLHYEEGALVPDGTPFPRGASAVSDYVPNARPGSRLPHAWLARDGKPVSSLDLIPHDAFVLIAGREGSAWVDAPIAERVPLERIVLERDVRDPTGSLPSLLGIENDGALLVRPDQHVAWRSPTFRSNPRTELERALEAIAPPA